MTLHQFNTLPEREQAIALREAVPIADREDADYTVYLFQLYSFYVEVYCHKIDPSQNRYRSFGSTNYLEPYLKDIPIGF